MDTYRDDEIIMVPVPKSRLADVYAALAKPAKEGADVPAEEKIEVPGQGSLTALMSSESRREAGVRLRAPQCFEFATFLKRARFPGNPGHSPPAQELHG